MRKFLLATISITAMSIAGAAFAQNGAAGAGAAAGSSVGGSTSGTSAGVGGSGAIGTIVGGTWWPLDSFPAIRGSRPFL